MAVVMAFMVILAVVTLMIMLLVLVEMRVNGWKGNDDETRVKLLITVRVTKRIIP